MEGVDEIAELDRQGAAAAVVDARARLLRVEAERLALAAHWADLHAEPAGGGAERLALVGGDGTPEVAEFAAAELAVLMQVSLAAAASMMADALDLRHRLPELWQAVGDGHVEAWKARKVASRVRSCGLTQAQALWVDLQVAPSIGSLPWSRFCELLEGAIVEVDPEAAEDRRQAAALERFVRTGRSSELGLTTIVARAAAGDAIFFVAMCDRLAQILQIEGDPDPVDVRRSRAIGILADPARALAMLQRHAETAAGGEEPAPSYGTACGTCGAVATDPSAVVRPMAVDASKLRPPATLFIHTSREAWERGRTTGRCGIARVEGVGAVTLAQAVEMLGHTTVTVREVLDLTDDRPVDAYEVPDRTRELLIQCRPATVFPWGAPATRHHDADHTVPYVSPDDGGPPGQTRVGNLGLISRSAHRVKTHGPGWRHRQPAPGVHLWRTPTGYWFRVDHRGSHALGRDLPPDAS